MPKFFPIYCNSKKLCLTVYHKAGSWQPQHQIQIERAIPWLSANQVFLHMLTISTFRCEMHPQVSTLTTVSHTHFTCVLTQSHTMPAARTSTVRWEGHKGCCVPWGQSYSVSRGKVQLLQNINSGKSRNVQYFESEFWLLKAYKASHMTLLFNLNL